CASEPSGCGIYKSTDAGDSWNKASSDLPRGDVSSLVIDPVHPNVIFAGMYGLYGAFKSVDSGASWTTFNDGVTNLDPTALAIDADATFLHAATPSGVFDIQLAPVEPNVIDDTQFFVRQHYRDFLNREADPDGLNFWAGEIFVCGSDPQCIEVKRI